MENKQINNDYLNPIDSLDNYWSQEKFQEMESSLVGYWSKDLWIGEENPFKDKNRTSLNLIFYQHSYIIKTELKFCIYTKMSNYEWSWGTVHVNNTLKIVVDFMGEFKEIQDNQSIINYTLEYWECKIIEYLKEKGRRDNAATSYSGNKYGKPQKHKGKDQRIYLMAHIYNFLTSFYDTRKEYDKDVWDIDRIKPNENHRREKRLNFSELKGGWLFQPTQSYIKYQLAIYSGTTVYNKLLSIRYFNTFLLDNYPHLSPQELDRRIIVNYITYLNNLPSSSYILRHHCLSHLKEFFELCQRNQWVNIPDKQLIFLDDFPKDRRQIKPNFIPDKVVKQIYRHIDKISYPTYRTMFLLQMQIGCRISDLRYLKYDCLLEIKENEYALKYWNHKQSKEQTIPISNDVVSLVKTQQKEVKEILGTESPYLFPSRRTKSKYKIKPVSSKAYSESIKRLIWENKITDANGQIWGFTSHQCRHTVATNMINDGVPQHIVQRYLGHDSPTMTQMYAHIHDETLRKEIEKYQESITVNFLGETVELEDTVLSSNDDLEWFKKNVQARALEHGYCARPKVLGDCDIPGFDGCYTCPHWRTNKNFLPILEDTLERTNKVIEKARNCGWELQVKKNEPIKENLEKVIQSLEEEGESDEQEN